MRARLLLLAVAPLLLWGCEPSTPQRVVTKQVQLHRLPDGRYAYQDADGAWWFALWLTQSNQFGPWAAGSAPSSVILNSSSEEEAELTLAPTNSSPATEEEITSGFEEDEGQGTSVSSSGPSASSPGVDEEEASPPAEESESVSISEDE